MGIDDNDFVPSPIETDAPNDGDGNLDGIADAVQSNVASLPGADTTDFVSLLTSIGTTITQGSLQSARGLALPDGAQPAFGRFELTVSGDDPGVVEFVFENEQPINAWYQLISDPTSPNPQWQRFLFDGERGAELIDEDGNELIERARLHFGSAELTTEIVSITVPAVIEKQIIELVGTTGNDRFNFSFNDTGQITVHNQSQHLGSFDPLFVAAIAINALAGNDRVFVDRAVSIPIRVEGGPGNDTIWTGSGNDVINGGPGRDQIFAGEGNDIIDGSDGNDGLFGGPGDDTISGGNGNDLICSGDGDDTIDGGAGIDLLHAGDGNDFVTGGTENDTLFGGPGDDELFGQQGNDLIRAGSGADIVDGGLGRDHIFGDSGNDVIDGGDGADRIDGGSGDDHINGGSGTDTLQGGIGDDTINGNDDADTIRGGFGDDQLFGGGDADRIYGNAGNDTLVGGAGLDILVGGGGNNTIVQDDLQRWHLAVAEGDFGNQQSDPTSFIVDRDVNGDGRVSALDALLIINQLGRRNAGLFTPAAAAESRFDVNRDDRVTALDALVIVNALDRSSIDVNNADYVMGQIEQAIPEEIALIADRNAARLKASADQLTLDVFNKSPAEDDESLASVDQILAQLDLVLGTD